MSHVVGKEQGAFVQDRFLFDNILLAQEMVKKYARKSVSPRCTIKVDIQKAFDSVNWEFLCKALLAFGVPQIMVNWISTCLTTSHFSLKINGASHGFIQGKRGLRQGDPLSPYLFIFCMEVLSRLLRKTCKQKNFSYHPQCSRVGLNHLVFADDLLIFTRGDVPSVSAISDCLTKFAKISGLSANPAKTAIYFGGTHHDIKRQILEKTDFTEGHFPFRYLGIPLNTSRLTVEMHHQLLSRIRQKLYGWAEHRLSYAGKTQLINSVIFGLQNFWSCAMLLPKTVIKGINKLCKDFLWGSQDHKRMIWKSWSSICLPRDEGGLGIKEVLSWNKCLLLKWIWKLDMNYDNYWSCWVQSYCLRGTSIWHVKDSAHYSMSWRHILAVRDEFISLAGSVQTAQFLLQTWSAGGHLNAKLAYDFFRTIKPKQKWYHTVWDNINIPRHSFIATLAIQGSLATVDNLIKRGLILVNRCVLCYAESETVHHLFFQCSFSATIWAAVQHWQRVPSNLNRLSTIMRWYTHCNRGRHFRKRQRRCALLATIYEIWRERNLRIFQGLTRDVAAIIYAIQIQVCVRALFKNLDGNDGAIVASLV